MTAPNTTRLEALLTTLLHAPSVTYASGLAAIHAAYTLLNPRRVAITGGYHGAHGVLSIHTRLSGTKMIPLECDAEELHEGDVVHLETPLNPTGEARNIRAYADKAHSRGAILFVDATFGPPGLQDPFEWGADIVMHSGTKYLGGHSDMLCGVLATRREDWLSVLKSDRLLIGGIMGSLEGWLGVRSLRTLELRVSRQSKSAEALVNWLDRMMQGDKGEDGEVVSSAVNRLQHASLQRGDMQWLKTQMPNGYGPVFAMYMKNERMARRLPSKLRLFRHATSLGGVESLIEWRVMSDKGIDRTLMRVSIGVESWEDLQNDMFNAFKELIHEESK